MNELISQRHKGGEGIMDLRQIEVVMTVCKAGGFTEAAKRLGVTQPTLSKIVANLESQLGLTLFERNGGVAKPTEHGRFFADRAEDVLSSVRGLSRDLEQLAAGEMQRLRVGYGPATRSVLVSGMIERLGVTHPNLAIEVRQGAGPALIRRINGGQHDIVFSWSEHAREYGDLTRAKIFEDDALAAVRPDHPLAGRRDLAPEELLEFRLASHGVPAVLKGWLGALTEAQTMRLTSFMTDDTDLIRARARQGDHVAVGARFMFVEDFARGDLAPCFLAWTARYECWMLADRSRWRLPLVQHVADVARQVARDSGL